MLDILTRKREASGLWPGAFSFVHTMTTLFKHYM